MSVLTCVSDMSGTPPGTWILSWGIGQCLLSFEGTFKLLSSSELLGGYHSANMVYQFMFPLLSRR